MYEVSVHAERTVNVSASPEVAWSLLTGAAVWRCFGVVVHAFDVAASPAGVGHLTCFLRRYRAGMACAVLETTESLPAERVVMQTQTTKPVAKEVYTFTMRPKRGALAVTIAVEVKAVPRTGKVDMQIYWGRHLKTWARAFKSELERDQPGLTPAWPPATTLEWITPVTSERWDEVGGTTLIEAPAEQVWETLYEPQTSVRLNRGSEHAAEYAGHVPGTPQRAIGEIQYTIHRHDDGQFIVALALVTDLVDGERATVRDHRFGLEVDQAVHRAPGGSELTLSYRWPSSENPDAASAIASNLDTQLHEYKTLIEAEAAEQTRKDT